MKSPPIINLEPEIASAFTDTVPQVQTKVVLKPVTTWPAALICASPVLDIPPICVKLPPTYHPPLPSGMDARIGPFACGQLLSGVDVPVE